jgi:transposase
MPRPCSIDLRERALTACEAGEGSQAEVAKRYRVGERTLSRWLRTAREEGRRGPKPPAHGRAPVGGGAEVLAALAAEHGDATLAATLAEYADQLAERTGVRRSLAAVCRALTRLGLVRKKRRPGPPSRAGRMSPRGGQLGVPSWLGSSPSARSSWTRPASTPA